MAVRRLRRRAGCVTSQGGARALARSSYREYVLEAGDVTDVALVRAAVADRHGNAVFHSAARNFNPAAAIAGRVTVLDRKRGSVCDHLVAVGRHVLAGEGIRLGRARRP